MKRLTTKQVRKIENAASQLEQFATELETLITRSRLARFYAVEEQFDFYEKLGRVQREGVVPINKLRSIYKQLSQAETLLRGAQSEAEELSDQLFQKTFYKKHRTSN